MSDALNKWKKLALSLAIILVINVFFNVGLQTFYPEPVYDDYCPVVAVDKANAVYSTAGACNEAGGSWVQPSGEGVTGYCDFYGDCYKAYDAAMQPYSRNAFVVLTILGVAILLGGLLVGTLPMAVANGLLYGGVLSILIGTMRYWGYMDDYLRFIVSGIALALLILVGIKRVKD